MTLKSFKTTIRNKLNLKEDTVLFFYHERSILTNNKTIDELYRDFKNEEDNFLYLEFSEINALG